MGSKREFLRICTAAPCILNYDGINYQTLLENISLGGALVKAPNDIPNRLHVGDECGLMLCSDIDLCPTRFSCVVTRSGSLGIGIKFQKPN